MAFPGRPPQTSLLCENGTTIVDAHSEDRPQTPVTLGDLPQLDLRRSKYNSTSNLSNPCPSPGPSVTSDLGTTPRPGSPLGSSRTLSACSASSESALQCDGANPKTPHVISQERVRSFIHVCAPEVVDCNGPAALAQRKSMFRRIDNWRRRGIILKDLSTHPEGTELASQQTKTPSSVADSSSSSSASFSEMSSQSCQSTSKDQDGSANSSAERCDLPSSASSPLLRPRMFPEEEHKRTASADAQLLEDYEGRGRLSSASSAATSNPSIRPRCMSMMSPGRLRAFIDSCATADEQAGRVPLSHQTRSRQKAMLRQIETWRRAGIDLDEIPDPPKHRI